MVQNKKKLFILVILFFAILSSWLPLSTPNKFVSPDENMYYYYTTLFAKTGNVSFEEPLNDVAMGLVRPRLTVVVNDKVSPMSYLGLIIIYGMVNSMSKFPILLITPLIATLGLIFFYLLISDNFNKKIGLLSTTLLLFFPPYVYYSSTGINNNIGALVFFIAGLFYYLKIFREDKNVYYVLFSIFWSIGCMFRYEFLVLVLLSLSLLAVNKVKSRTYSMNYRSICLVISVFFVIDLPILLLNKKLYGSFLSTGTSVYAEKYLSTNLSNLMVGEFSSKVLLNILLFDFVHVLNIFFILFIVGVLLYKQGIYERAKIFSLILVTSFLFLLFFFGNEGYYGYGTTSLGSSYVRYFLPVYILMLPYVAISISKLADFKRPVSLFLITLLIISSAIPTWSVINDTKIRMQEYSNISNRYVDSTEPQSVVFSTVWSKIIFPERKVGTYDPLLVSPNDLAETMMHIAENGTSVYYVNDGIDIEILQPIFEARGYDILLVDKWLHLYEIKCSGNNNS
jgi:hypothetical protein